MIARGMRGLLIVSLAMALASCSGKSAESDSYDTTTSSVVSGAIAGAASASDSGGSVVALELNSGEKPSALATFKKFFDFLPKAYAQSCLLAAKVKGQTCAGVNSDTISIDLGGCTGFNSAVWTGTVNLAFDSGATCTAATDPVTGGMLSMGNGNSVTISSAGGITRDGAAGYSVVTDSTSSGYNQAVSGGTTITCNSADCSTGPGRTVNILGEHRALYSPSSVKLFDHSISTPTPLTITGAGANKVISAGTIQVQHNLAQYTASATITQSLTFSALCCHPTGGQVTVTFTSGSKTGSEVIDYGPSCGEAAVDGHSVSLIHCQ